jgi:hypothetical protein
MRLFFLQYADQINRLAEQPRWYHGLTANCTTAIYLQGRARIRWDWRILFNGNLDRLFYERKRLDQSMPFDQLKSLSRITDLASEAPENGFGDFIRQRLKGYRKP